MQLSAAFGVSWPRNDKALARCLLDLEQHAHGAVAPARAALAALPRDREAARLVFDAELAAGEVEAAAASASRLAPMLPAGEERRAVVTRAANAVAAAAEARLTEGDTAEARRLLEVAQKLVDDTPEVLVLEARLTHRSEGEPGLRRLLAARGLAEAGSGAGQPLLPAPDAPAPLPAVRAGANLAALRLWTPRERLGELEKEIETPEAVLDEVEENRAYKKSLIERAEAGDAGSEDELVLLRDAAAEDLLALALSGTAGCDVASRCFSRMGASIIPALFAAFTRLRERRPFGGLFGGSAATVVGKIVQGFGRDALPHFEQLLVATDRDLRKIAIDYFLGLGDPVAFERIVEWIAPLEVIHRLNAAPSELLRPFLARIAPATVLADLLLVDPTFHRDLELVHALREAPSAEGIVGVLCRRGYDGDLAEALLELLGVPGVEPAVWTVLASYGPQTIDHLVSAYADLDRPADVRRRLREALLERGGVIVVRVCSCFGTTPSPLDAELQALLADVGEAGVEALVLAYEQSSWRERLSAGLVSRYTNRRVAIIRALAAVAGPSAQVALEKLLAREADPNLRLRLQEMLQRRRA